MAITKEQFLAAYNKFPPSNWCKFAFRYFSTNAKEEDKWLKKSFQYFLIALFIVGFTGVAFNWGNLVVGIATIAFTIGLGIVGILMGSAAILNNFRILRIRMELGGISKLEYMELVRLYM